MSKKKRPARLRRNPTSREVATKLTSSFSLLTVIVIEPGNQITDPDPLACLAGAPVVWLVRNHDSVRHTVEVDPATFKRKDNKKHEHPFPKNDKLSTTIEPKQFHFFVGKIKDDAVPQEYKYSITSFSPNGTSVTFDPDLDVVDPGSVI